MADIRKNAGFTLIEILIAVAIISVLSGIVFYALDPGARFEDSRNTKRKADCEAILGALKMYQADHDGAMFEQAGSLPAGLYFQIGSSPMNECSSECLLPGSAQLEIECINFSELSELGYLPVIPVDAGNPDSSEEKTGYFIMRGANGRLSAGACISEPGSSGTTSPIIFTN